MSSIFLPLIFLPARLLVTAMGSKGKKMGGQKNEKQEQLSIFLGCDLE
jgi:hypothetical protein